MNALFRTAAAVGALTLLVTAGHAAEDALPTLKSTWKIDLPGDTKRVAVADVTGDKTLRLLTLDGAGVLTVRKMADAAPVKEDTITLGDNADQFAVGQFAKDKPAVVVVPGAVFYRDGDKYAKKSAADIKKIMGTVRYADGVENFLVFEQANHGEPQGYSIDLSADNPVKAGNNLPQPDQKPEIYRDISPVLPPEMLQESPFPDALKKGNILRLFFFDKTKKMYALVAWQATTAHLALLNGSDLFHGPDGGELKPAWKSPALSGKILEIAFGTSLKDPKQGGVYVLEQSGDDGKGRQLEFFSIE
jgi:hypothetical protein